MTFDLQNYRTSKAEVIELIKKSHAWESNEGFVADGVINPEIFAKQKVKILCLLGETYGYGQSKMTDIESQGQQDILGVGSPTVKTPQKIGALIWILIKSLEDGAFVKWDDVPYLFKIEEEAKIQLALSKIAWVNVKKASNSNVRQDYKQIYDSAGRNSEIITEQINSICPNLIIVCSDAVFDGLSDADLLGNNIVAEKRKIQTNEKGQKIIYLSHPSYPADWGYESVYELAEELYNDLK
jgi:hypothetical protein